MGEKKEKKTAQSNYVAGNYYKSLLKNLLYNYHLHSSRQNHEVCIIISHHLSAYL